MGDLRVLNAPTRRAEGSAFFVTMAIATYGSWHENDLLWS